MKLLFYIICSLSLLNGANKSIDLNQFNSFCIVYFQNIAFSDTSEQSLNQAFSITEISEYLQESESIEFNHILANHFLFRYFLSQNELELAYQHGIRSLESSDNFFDTEFIQDVNYIRGYYFYYSKQFDTWMSLKHLLRGVRTNIKNGLNLILTGLDINSMLYQLNLVDQFQIQYELFDYSAAIHTLNSLLVDTKHKKIIFKKIADLNFQIGEFEQAISIYQQIASDQSLSEQIDLTSKIVASYFYVAEFDISKQYIKRYLDPLQIINSKLILELIVRMEMTEKQTEMDSIIQFCIANYSLPISLNDYKQHINQPLERLIETDLYLNRKNLRIAEAKISKMESKSDSLYATKQFYLAKLYWAKQDYFNSKRYLHNLLNKYHNYFDRHMSVQANFILANIAFESNDFDQSKQYLETADPSFLYFYQRPRLQYLNQQFELND